MLIFRGIVLVKRTLWALGRVFAEPLKLLWHVSVRLVIAPLYRLYFKVAQRAHRGTHPGRNILLAPFTSRYVIHGVIVLLTLFVATNNLYAYEVRTEDIASQSLISTLLGTDEGEIVVRASDDAAAREDIYRQLSAVSSSSIVNGDIIEDSELQTTQGGSSLVKSNSLETTIGNRPRNEVEYYVVQGGDTISTIATRFGISTDTVLWENQLRDTDLIKPGQKLTILPESGVSLQVQKGDTLASIAKKYGVDVDSIVEYNKLASAEAIKSEMILLLPNAKVPELAPPTPTRIASAGGNASPSGNIPAPAAVTGSWTWPTNCRKINQYFGYRHTGVDIDDCGAGANATIYAARAGTVLSVGWGSGYGLHIVVDHGGGIKTLYAHLTKVYVSAGQSVGAGAALGGQGCTGWCTGTHLHFEIIINGTKVNPLSYL